MFSNVLESTKVSTARRYDSAVYAVGSDPVSVRQPVRLSQVLPKRYVTYDHANNATQ